MTGTDTLVMGIVNVTPDSFSDGGEWFERQGALTHGLDLIAQGASIIDVGGESTRPGALRPDEAEERRRVVPVIADLVERGVRVSVDTMRASVARAAVEAGATMVNDVSGGLADPDMVPFVADSGVEFVLMHWRGHSLDMQDHARYDDVVAEVSTSLREGFERVVAAGVAPERVILDPGLGFAKTAEHNWALLAHLDRLTALGAPLLVGTSRKTFLGHLAPDAHGNPSPPSERDAATTATSVLCAQAGVWGVRVHDVASTVAALRVLDAVAQAS